MRLRGDQTDIIVEWEFDSASILPTCVGCVTKPAGRAENHSKSKTVRKCSSCSNMSASKAKLILKCRNDLIDIHRHALEAIKPENLSRNSIQVIDGSLVVKSKSKLLSYNLSNTGVHVVGGGKSVLGMAMGLADVAKRSNIRDIFSHGRLSIPVGLEASICAKTLDSIGIKCDVGSSHNLPDQASVEASQKILNTISAACHSDRARKQDSLFIVLLSGGGSACLTSPRYISLIEKLEMIKFLVQRGADIVELNKVRRFYSEIKGGGLARHILSHNPDSKILSLILSDVINDPIEFIASGPTYLSPNQNEQVQRDQAYQVLTRYGYQIRDSIHAPINDSIDYGHVEGSLVNHIIGNNKLAIDAAIHRAQSLGYHVITLGSALQGDTKNVVDKLIKSAKEAFVESKVGRILVIGGGETTVKKDEEETWGLGGRAQELALDYIISCLSAGQFGENESNMVDMLLAGTTDGQDGPTDVGACLASHAEVMNVVPDDRVSLRDALAAKSSHDSHNFWKQHRPHWLVETGLTGTNVMDLYMLSLTSLDDQTRNESKL